MLKRICFSMIVLIAAFAPVLPVYADNGHSHSEADPGPGVTVGVTVTGGDFTDAFLTLNGNYPDVFINNNAGYYENLLGTAAAAGYYAGSQAGSQAATGAVQSSTPNSTYSQASTGVLPLPNITSDGRVAAVDSPDTQWVPGWQGYFCPKSNEDITVYKGSGCGGTWGVCDGYPDMWVRRQIAGLAPEFRQTQNKLDTSIMAVSKLILVAQEHEDNIVNTQDALRQHLAQLSVLSSDLSILEKEHNALKDEVRQQKQESDRKIMILFIVFSIGMLAMAGYIIFMTLSNRWQRVAVEKKGLFSRPAA